MTIVWDYPDGATTAAAGQLRMMRSLSVWLTAAERGQLQLEQNLSLSISEARDERAAKIWFTVSAEQHTAAENELTVQYSNYSIYQINLVSQRIYSSFDISLQIDNIGKKYSWRAGFKKLLVSLSQGQVLFGNQCLSTSFHAFSRMPHTIRWQSNKLTSQASACSHICHSMAKQQWVNI